MLSSVSEHRSVSASSTLTLLSRGGPPDVYAEVDRADRAEQKADRLQLKLDAERGLTASLRAQLRATSIAAQQAAQQARALHGAPGALNMPAASDSLVGMQRATASLRDRLDMEKKAANALQAQCAHLRAQLQCVTRERNATRAAHEQTALTLQRKSAELEKAHELLRASGSAHDDAIAELCSLTMARGKETAQAGAQQAALKAALDAERRRAAAQAAREETRLRRSRACAAPMETGAWADSGRGKAMLSGIGSGSTSGTASTSEDNWPSEAEALLGSVPPSSSVAAMAAAADDVRTALARAEEVAEKRRVQLQVAELERGCRRVHTPRPRKPRVFTAASPILRCRRWRVGCRRSGRSERRLKRSWSGQSWREAATGQGQRYGHSNGR